MENMKKLIAYSLWGNNPKYTEGAVVNALQTPEVYPGWTSRFYCGDSVPDDITDRLQQAGAEVIRVRGINDNRGMFWRFWALADEDVERVIMRDTDSRLTPREKAAVDEWERSGLAGHIMRDHPYHGMPVMGGMWGCKGGLFRDVKTMIDSFSPTSAHNQDQLFLERVVYPRLIEAGCCVHDPFFRYESSARPFPTPRQGYAFVGEAIGSDGQREDHWQILREYEQNPWRRLRFACKRQILALRLRLFGKIG